MCEISTPEFDDCRNWIRKAREKGIDWQTIKNGLIGNSLNINEFLTKKNNEEFWPEELNPSIWFELVESEIKGENESLELSEKGEKSAIIVEGQDSGVSIPKDKNSSWQLYRKHLLESGFKLKAVDEIERSTLSILKTLNSDTVDIGAVKGLVIGHVQSGKTANMAALMAMAADWTFNFFIVLSGTIENLRRQTQERLLRDLYRNGNINWIALEHLSKNCNPSSKPSLLQLQNNSNNRYFTVALKNKTRLHNLLEWLHYDKSKLQQMKIVIIDDEADQASINTSDITKEERTAINNKIINLVMGNNARSEKVENGPKAVNYISYTATPYANFLNESAPESLYPSNFIRALKPSAEYFGPIQIFGLEENESKDGLNILRCITEYELEWIKSLHKREKFILPSGLEDALVWFFSCVAAMRILGYKKPISMLVHTSQKQDHHDAISEAIQNWFKSENKDGLIEKCREIWKMEKEEFNMNDFREQYPEYGMKNEEIFNYPIFEDIEPELKRLISDISYVALNDEGDLEYFPYVHLCVDNCSKTRIDEDGMHLRLAYPSPTMEPYPSPAPAFIVIGGSTLSRGLTIEGLVSTYFLRTSAQADTLMQMGRWFGYRKGYELFPRIWMEEATIDKFRFLAKLEDELRDDLVQFMELGKKPSEYGPKVKNSPKTSWLKITSKNKMQSAEEVDMDYTGTSVQLITYENEYEKLLENIHITENFIRELGNPELSHSQSAYVWANVDYKVINDKLLSIFYFNERARIFNNIPTFSDWVTKVTEDNLLDNWNVIVAGNGDVNAIKPDMIWDMKHIQLEKVVRSKRIVKNGDERLIDIGALRSPKDLVADVDISKLSEESLRVISKTVSNREIDRIRKEVGIDKKPQLIIYRIDKNSKAKDGSKTRKNLEAEEDLIGLCLNIPGLDRGNYARKLTVKISLETSDPDLEDLK